MHSAGVVKAEIDGVVVVGEELVMAYLQIGVVEWQMSSAPEKPSVHRCTGRTRET